MALSDAAVRALRHADQMIREAGRGDVFTVYDACRVAACSLAPVDDFYVGLLQPRDRRISYPYMFSNGSYEETGTLTYGPGGVVAWVLASQRPYRYRDDDGALLNRGMRFGDDELSADAVVVPMLGEDGVVGVLGALSDTPGSLGDEVVTALEWLAGLVLDRVLAARPGRRLNLPLVYPELQDSGRAGVLMSVNQTATALTEMAAEVEGVRHLLVQDPSDPAVQDRLAALARRCFQVQASLVTRLGHQAGSDPDAGDRSAAEAIDPLEGLSPRERAVVELVTSPEGDPGNAGVARALGIGPATVKTHMASVLSKLGLQHRSELRWLVGRVTPPR
ncbi:LuxR C-terminal-related transcriptional regulator [Intrasporangium flavum]|uniref:LuxR C-terminal-related transcriptional regulator n=1 Tax=Intrasporangium flavum TaxID=1428657 RepID=UPI00096E55D9|nr:LuxR C-terminal-related transcriptional regulator [Intrasporangium flavum]